MSLGSYLRVVLVLTLGRGPGEQDLDGVRGKSMCSTEIQPGEGKGAYSTGDDRAATYFPFWGLQSHEGLWNAPQLSLGRPGVGQARRGEAVTV